MKRIVFMLLILDSNIVFAQDIPIVNMELIKAFPAGHGEDQFALCLKCPSESGPTAIAFDKEGNLYISDILAERLVKFDSAFNRKGEYHNGYAKGARQLFVADNGEFITINSTTFAVDDSNGNKKFTISLRKSSFNDKIPSRPDFVYIDNEVFFRINSGELIKIDNPGIDSEKNVEKATKVIQNNSDKLENGSLRSMNESNQNDKLKIEKLNSEDIVTYDNTVKTINFSIFNKFWKIKREEEKKQLSRNGNLLTKEPEEMNLDIFKDNSSSTFTFIGKDSDGNYYWDANANSVCVFNNKGSLIKYFNYDINKSKTRPTIHPSGDVYFLDYDEKEVRLYKVSRVW
jgi:hypothetical protein